MATDAGIEPPEPSIPEEEQRVTEDAAIALVAGVTSLAMAALGHVSGDPRLAVRAAVVAGAAGLLAGAVAVVDLREPKAVGNLAYAIPCAVAAVVSVPPENLLAVATYGLIAVMGLARAFEATFGGVLN